jgi:hypothetical protein
MVTVRGAQPGDRVDRQRVRADLDERGQQAVAIRGSHWTGSLPR